MWTIAGTILKRHLFSWLFEVLPVALLLLQSAVAVSHHGDVDARFWRGPAGLGARTSGKLSSLLGAWRVQEWQGMDKFLEELHFPRWQRVLAKRAGQSYELELRGGSDGGSLDDATLRIVTSDLRGKSELELPLSGRSVLARDGDGGAEVSRSARPLDDHTVEITERYPKESRPYSVCTRTLTDDGRMILEVRKRTPAGRMASMRAIASRIVDKAAKRRARCSA